MGGWGGMKDEGGGRACKGPRPRKKADNSISYKVRPGSSPYPFLEERNENQSGMGDFYFLEPFVCKLDPSSRS